ncbi:MAG: tRNA (uridine(34)/cytosine(34)/5-carboxymethylaminomethyluridine(34)-2'-O)-methyltransferase TrmL [Gammaproteobacteria bacterium]|nr:MAG: tRNA (uridine(34)/cytosine(34)/5-carboxymethylaminomethyluridine(34)-2'-O)-methyltransferase TrmL [Gammaproteobacteria bacterium]
MIHIALYQPKIPPNTGNIIRFCANTGVKLHLIHPLGFTWDNKQLRRAGLDYAEFASIQHYDDWMDFLSQHQDSNKYIITTKGLRSAYKTVFKDGDMLIFGSEDGGIAAHHMADIDSSHWLRIPMKGNSRSMNLSNTVAILGYEALRQLGLPDLY